MEKKTHGYFNDDGTEFNPDLMSKQTLCTTCKKDNDISEETLCNLTRVDQHGEETFQCYAYESISEE